MEYLEKMKEIIQKKKGSKRRLRYSTRKLSIGVVSCMLGFWICITPTVAMAADIKPVETSKLVVSASETGNKEASGNVDSENIGYAPNAKYNFQDLKFNPAKIEKGMKTNQLGFEIYGKHNIAASTSNWKIRLQIDERLSKYIKSIEVDAKAPGGRRTLVRQSDTIGRKTNIWEVNYIRANSGLFAGGETTDTQVAPNGIITFEKNIDEIMAEIGDENLALDKLGYRIYLTSVKDGGKIVPGIDSTGSFRTYMDTQMSAEESPNNTEWFKYAAIGARYMENEKKLGANGAIVVDHNISKNRNFAYGVSAKETPWKLQFKIDKRLVKYVDGIELHKMGSAGAVAPDFSLENKNNVKVADLSIERDPNKENYGMGEITDNDLGNIVEFNNASPRPTVIRYVYRLNKPINEILDELKKEAGVEEGNSFGEDFDFDAWITDVNEKLITNTWGSGYYRIQDVDGDGKTDDSESNKETSPYISEPTIKSVYEGDRKVAASVLLNENAGKGNVAVLVNKDGEEIARVENLDAVDENGAPKTILKEFTFAVADAGKLGKAGDELTVKIIPSDQRYQEPEIGKTVLKEAPMAVKSPIETYKGTKLDTNTEFAKSGIANKDNMPEGTIYSWKTVPDTKEVGDTTGVVLVKVPDREDAFEVTIPVSVVQGLELTVKTPEKQTEGVAVKENTKVITTNQKNAKVTASHDEGNNTGLSIDSDGNLIGTPENFVWGEKDSATYEEQEVTLHAVVQSEDGKEEKTADVIVTVQRDTDKDGVPDVKDDDDDNDGIKDKEEIEKGSDPKDPDSIPQTDIKPIGKVDITNATQTVVEGNDIKVIEIKAEDEKAVIEVGELPAGLNYDKENKTITGIPEVTDWGKTEEERVLATKVKVTNEDGSVIEKEVKITVQRDTDKDGVPDVKDDDDDNDGIKDKEEIEKGSDPKDPDSIPQTDIKPIGKVDITNATQTVVEGNDIKVIEIKAEDEKAVIEVGELPAGLNYDKENKTITGTPEVTDWGKTEEERVLVTKVKITNEDGSAVEKEVKITVKKKSDAEKYEAQGQDITVDKDSKANASDAIANKKDLPKDTEYDWKTPIDTSKAGEQTGTVVVKYPDGTTDEVEVKVTVVDNRTDAEKYKAEGGTVNKPYGETATAEEIVAVVTTDAPKEKVQSIEVTGTIPTEGTNKNVSVVVTYADGSNDTVMVIVNYGDASDTYAPIGQTITVDKGSQPNAADGIANKSELAKNTTYGWAEPVDTTTAGKKTGTIIVTYPDNSTDRVTVDIIVNDTTTDTEKYTAQGGTVNKPYGETATVEEIVAVVTTDAPKEKVQSIEVTGTIPTEGTNKNASVVVTYADGSNDTVMVIVNYGNASDTYAPIGQTITVDKGSQPNAADGIANKSELPQNTTYGWAEPVNTTTAGKKTGTIIVIYPDNSTDRVTVDIIVNDTETDAEKYDPQTKPEVIKPGEKPDLTDNVVNRDELPEGTIIQDVTPDGAINIQKPGEYTGTLEITYPDGSKETVEVQVIVKPNENQDTNSDKNNHNNTTTDKNNHNNATSDKTTGAGNNAGKHNGTTAKKAPKTGDTANIAAYASALAASTVALLGVTFSKKRKKEEDDVL